MPLNTQIEVSYLDDETGEERFAITIGDLNQEPVMCDVRVNGEEAGEIPLTAVIQPAFAVNSILEFAAGLGGGGGDGGGVDEPDYVVTTDGIELDDGLYELRDQQEVDVQNVSGVDIAVSFVITGAQGQHIVRVDGVNINPLNPQVVALSPGDNTTIECFWNGVGSVPIQVGVAVTALDVAEA